MITMCQTVLDIGNTTFDKINSFPSMKSMVELKEVKTDK